MSGFHKALAGFQNGYVPTPEEDARLNAYNERVLLTDPWYSNQGNDSGGIFNDLLNWLFGGGNGGGGNILDNIKSIALIVAAIVGIVVVKDLIK
jgi:hypothetical protein